MEPIPSGFLDRDRTHPIAEVRHRERAQVQGRARSVRVRPWGDVPTLELVLADATAAITVAFLGRRRLAGVDPGSVLTVEGMVGGRNGKLVILNPAYRLGP
ncbi:MAG: OB-fold nucleic acid binding domain-containing protein [Aquihabitans sp.]